MNSGFLKLTATNSYRGATAINGGTLAIGRANALTSTAAIVVYTNGTLYPDDAVYITNVVTLAGGVYQFVGAYNGGNKKTYATPVRLTADSTIRADNYNYAFNGHFSSDAPYTVRIGVGELYLMGDRRSDSWKGDVRILGSANLVHTMAIGCLGSGTVTVDAGGTLSQDTDNLNRDLTLNGGTYQGGNLSTTGNLTLLVDSTVKNRYGKFSLNGTIAGAARGRVDAAGYSVAFGQTNSMNGIELQGGTLYLTKAGAQGTGSVSIANGATLQLDVPSSAPNWTMTNSIVSQGTSAALLVEAAQGASTLTVCRVLAPGTTNGVGILTVKGSLTLAPADSTPATFAILVNGTNASGAYSQLLLTNLSGSAAAVNLNLNN